MDKNLITPAAQLLRKHSLTKPQTLFSISNNVVLNINPKHFESSIPVRSQSTLLTECNTESWNCTWRLWAGACWEGQQIAFNLCLSTGGSTFLIPKLPLFCETLHEGWLRQIRLPSPYSLFDLGQQKQSWQPALTFGLWLLKTTELTRWRCDCIPFVAKQIAARPITCHGPSLSTCGP